MSELKEKCAVAGASTANPEIDAVDITFMALEVQQHRGDAASGIASMNHDGRFDCYSGPGMVKDVYTPEILARLAGAVAIGHNRYPTSGGHIDHNQPIEDKALRLGFAQNGNLSEMTDLDARLRASNIDIKWLNDTEKATYAVAQLMRSGGDLPSAIEETYPLLNGSFSCVAQHGDMMVAFRDPLGIRPLSLGAIEGGYMVSSETCGFYPSGATLIGDIKPGEMVILTNGEIERRQVAGAKPKLDIFELVYFCSPDSELFGESVGQIRYRLGLELAEQYPFDGDYLVVGAPDSAIPIAEGYARARNMEHRQVIVKRRFQGGRSFQQPTQAARQKYLEKKFTSIGGAADGRDVILIDDSIVRLNTARVLNRLLMQAGAKSVTILTGSPPIGWPDFSGIDTPSQDKLVAASHTPEEIRQLIGCRFLGYLSLSRMVRATGQPADVFNLACFNGDYPYEIGDHRKNIKEPVSMGYLEETD